MSNIPDLRTRFQESISNLDKSRQQAAAQVRHCDAEILKYQGALAALDMVEIEVKEENPPLEQPLPEEIEETAKVSEP